MSDPRLKKPLKPLISEPEREILATLKYQATRRIGPRSAWATPLDLGGGTRSDHVKLLRRLVAQGYVATKQRWQTGDGETGPDAWERTKMPHRRGARAYRITADGIELIDAIHEARREIARRDAARRNR